jgi:hypothetical protein
MDNEKLLIGGGILIALVIAIPILAPMLSDEGKYDAVADTHTLQQLNDAVTAYGQAHGQYPASLHHLVPEYIDEIPLTSTRLQFAFNARTGLITNPSAPVLVKKDSKKKSGNSRRNRGGGISPATDAMTGLGVSQELNY